MKYDNKKGVFYEIKTYLKVGGGAKKLKLASVEKVIDFTYENRLNQKISKKDIRERGLFYIFKKSDRTPMGTVF